MRDGVNKINFNKDKHDFEFKIQRPSLNPWFYFLEDSANWQFQFWFSNLTTILHGCVFVYRQLSQRQKNNPKQKTLPLKLNNMFEVSKFNFYIQDSCINRPSCEDGFRSFMLKLFENG